jgi:hypothetical protein
MAVLISSTLLYVRSTCTGDTTRHTAANITNVISFNWILILNIMCAVLLYHLVLFFRVKVLLSKWSVRLFGPL